MTKKQQMIILVLKETLLQLNQQVQRKNNQKIIAQLDFMKNF